MPNGQRDLVGRRLAQIGLEIGEAPGERLLQRLALAGRGRLLRRAFRQQAQLVERLVAGEGRLDIGQVADVVARRLVDDRRQPLDRGDLRGNRSGGRILLPGRVVSGAVKASLAVRTAALSNVVSMPLVRKLLLPVSMLRPMSPLLKFIVKLTSESRRTPPSPIR